MSIPNTKTPLLDQVDLPSDLRKLPFTYKSELVKAQQAAPPFGTNATLS